MPGARCSATLRPVSSGASPPCGAARFRSAGGRCPPLRLPPGPCGGAAPSFGLLRFAPRSPCRSAASPFGPPPPRPAAGPLSLRGVLALSALGARRLRARCFRASGRGACGSPCGPASPPLSAPGLGRRPASRAASGALAPPAALFATPRLRPRRAGAARRGGRWRPAGRLFRVRAAPAGFLFLARLGFPRSRSLALRVCARRQPGAPLPLSRSP